jgi:hypothetical protein
MNIDMKKQTAVEYLIQEIKNDVFVHSKSTKEWNHIFKQALAMEKEQIIDAYLKPLSNEYWFQKDEILNQESEKYYNETYGGDK